MRAPRRQHSPYAPHAPAATPRAISGPTPKTDTTVVTERPRRKRVRMFGVQEILNESLELGFRDESLRIALPRQGQGIQGRATRRILPVSVHPASDESPDHGDDHAHSHERKNPAPAHYHRHNAHVPSGMTALRLTLARRFTWRTTLSTAIGTPLRDRPEISDTGRAAVTEAPPVSGWIYHHCAHQ